MKLKASLYTIGLITLVSCSNLHNQEMQNEFLISCQSEFVMNDGRDCNMYYDDRSLFIESYTSCIYSGDTLWASTLHDINSCGNIIGDIRFSNDSLFLETRDIGKELCTSTEFHLFEYIIVKDNIENYTIVF